MRKTPTAKSSVLNWDDEAFDKYEELRDRGDSILDNALEDALDLIDTDPSSPAARQSRLESVPDEPTMWIVDAPARHPLLRIFWQLHDDVPTIAFIEEYEQIWPGSSISSN
ncbi:Mycobacterium numidiamassiliense ORFan [Mycobacterium numidiamassiliense]|uniref:Mycobacterium numidiamassiliense ORFan n=1 Tax=Mycobacterium numidiamassiliense TaxID=1841861 RepID=A0A2U3PIP0_9MYCO|nr:hypothetical protein [Mycobacterium numidiamassiliense]SPM43630.1 Mycobacterium numidiamassiliense ORFan [Mycobacterium numidiamassiliense]